LGREPVAYGVRDEVRQGEAMRRGGVSIFDVVQTVSVATVVLWAVVVGTPAEVVAGKFNAVLKVGQPAPAWEGLLGVDGKRHSLGDLKDARAVLLVFLSNRCPMTRSYEARLKKLASGYRKSGLAVIGVSIGHSPTDRLEKMEHHDLRDAIRAVLAGKRPEVFETLQKGCEIKYLAR
jgi:hypothetical protein